MLTIIEDANNKIGKHDIKNKWWSDQGVKVWRYRLPVGDYIIMNDKVQDVIDRKARRGVPVKMMDFLGKLNNDQEARQLAQTLFLIYYKAYTDNWKKTIF